MQKFLKSDIVDEVGNKYGRLTILKYEGKDKKYNRPMFRCQCDCGGIVTVPIYVLRSGNTKSCGCYQREQQIMHARKAKGQAGFNRLYREYKRSAKNKGHSFELTKEDLSLITKMNCHYCGVEPSTVICGDPQRPGRHGDYTFNGIDRIDNSKGYTMDNVAPCCKLCNYMKRGLSATEFLRHIKSIHNHRRL